MALSVYSQIEGNKTRSLIIMVFFTVFIAMIAYIMGKVSGYGISWAGIALIFAGLTSLGSYYWGDKIVLAMSGANLADRKRDFDLYTVTENLAIGAGLPKPKVYIIEDASPNAFATGRDPKHAVVCVTRGLLDKMDRNELEGVIAHEMSHVGNYDTRLMAIVTVLVGTVAFMSDWFMRILWWGGGRRDREDRGSGEAIILVIGIILAILSPIIAVIIQLAISRKREFLADASGALLTKNPVELASALEKIANDPTVMRGATNATAHLFITNPFKGKSAKTWFAGLFDTHPPIEDRIRILRSM